MVAIQKQVEIQKEYYSNTAEQYDKHHIDGDREHEIAFDLMCGLSKRYNVSSILDIGSGTGRVSLEIKKQLPKVNIIGIEPSEALRSIAYKKGLNPSEIVDGNAMSLNYNDCEFDLVCEFAALHHIPRPELAVREMLRVARRYIFISDSNNFGHGSLPVRSLKQGLNLFKCWKIFDLIKTRGKGYTISEGDGLAYSYSVFNNYDIIKKECSAIYVMNTSGNGFSHYRQSSNIALFGVKHKI